MSCNVLSIFFYSNKSNTQKLQSEESCAITACLTNLATFPGTSSALAAAADDWVGKRQRAIPESFCSPDQRTFQQHVEEGTSTLRSQSAKKLGKRRISESSAEYGT